MHKLVWVYVASLLWVPLECGQGTDRQEHHVIVFFVRYEKEEKPVIEYHEKLRKTIASPTKLAKKLLKQYIGVAPVEGLYATYAGFVARSTADGQITLPRRQVSDELFIVITPVVRPVIIHGNTVQHFNIPEDAPAAFYHAERKKDATGTYSWDIKKVETPKSRRVPPLALLILADPTNFMVPEGAFPADPGPNLLLPEMYITKKLSLGINALLLLRVNRYFAPVRTMYNKKTDRYQQITLG